MKIAVIGAGGVGGYFGGRLALTGSDVTFIARNRQLEALRNGELRVDSILGNFSTRVKATDRPEDVGPVDFVIVAVKTWQLADAVIQIGPMMGPNTLVVPLLNGVDAPSELAKTIGNEHVLGGFCRILSFVQAPGHVRHVGAEPYVAIGNWFDTTHAERASKLVEAWKQAGVRAEIVDDIRVAMWQKFLMIACWSGVGAVTRAPVGVWRSMSEPRELFSRAMSEVIAVARAGGVILPPGASAATLAFIDASPPDGTASMQRDVMEGRPSELASQSGAVVRLGRELGVPVPSHEFIYAALLPLEKRARGEVVFG